ncbi:MAG: glycosyltransferase family 4 protein [bacterium]|nr:glycosyltransferase family 4 protein [bacterium]
MNGKPWSSSKPTNLHLAHSWGGGLGRWVDDFAYADRSSENLVFESFGTIECYGIGLRLTHPASGTILDSWVLRHPISEVRGSHPEYTALLAAVCSRYGIEHVYVSSLIGHTLDVFRLGVPVTQIHHDYFSYCPTLYTVRDGVCTSCTLDDLKLCKNVDAPYRPKNSPHYYLKHRDAYFDAVVAAAVRHVCPSRGLAANLRRLDSRFESIDFTVIEHGVTYRKRDCFGGAEQDRRLRVGLLGHLAWYKGLELMRRLFETVRVIADFHFIGSNQGGAEFAGRWGSRLVPRYSQDELPAILERDRLDLTLFLPLVPESFSYTLSEAWCFCIPPAARPVGALAERIDDGNDGFFLGPEDDDVIDFLLEVDRDRDRLRHLAARLRSKPVRTLEDAVRDYYTLRRDDPAPREER